MSAQQTLSALAEKIERLERQRDELAAQVEVLQNALKWVSRELGIDWLRPEFEEADEALRMPNTAAADILRQRDAARDAGYVEQIKWLEKQVEELKSRKFARFHNEECWLYDSDESMDSLVCPVVISVADLRQRDAQTVRAFAVSMSRAGAEFPLPYGEWYAKELELKNA